jgi:ferredoxin-NADP reductase
MAHVLPASLARAVDQARLDAASIVDGLRGVRAPAFSTREQPLARPVALEAIDPIEETLPALLARPYATLARDVRTVVRELRGDRLAATVERTRARRPRRAPTSAHRTLEVRSLAMETRDALAITLGDPTGRAIEFVPGQFLTLHLTIDGRHVRRAYSIASTREDGPTATIVVKRIEGGLASTHLHRTLRARDRIEVSGPSGRFVVPSASAPRHLVMFAGGSGITPIVSILQSALAHEPGARATLVYGNRSDDDVVFRDRLDALEETHAHRLRVVHLLETPAPRAHRIGVPDASMITSLVRELALDVRMPGEEAPLFFVCGPAPMMASVRRALEDAGIDAARILEERFLSPADPLERRIGPATPQTITLRTRGVLRTFEQRPGETILEAATRTGIELPSSCTMGGCGACRCRATSGEVIVEPPSCLSEAERAEGYVLTCIGRASGPVTLEVP